MNPDNKLGLYILAGGRIPTPCANVHAWAEWLEKANRHVGYDTVGAFRVSTVFLGIDHNFGHGKPLLFETMVFGPTSWSETMMDRYSTWVQAEKGHAAMVARVKQINAQISSLKDVPDAPRVQDEPAAAPAPTSSPH